MRTSQFQKDEMQKIIFDESVMMMIYANQNSIELKNWNDQKLMLECERLDSNNESKLLN